MVKKLFKHEYHFYLRIMAIVYGILLTMSVATRLIASFESDTQAYEIIRTFALTTYYISILAAFGSLLCWALSDSIKICLPARVI